jgi:hypothetical protein
VSLCALASLREIVYFFTASLYRDAPLQPTDPLLSNAVSFNPTAIRTIITSSWVFRRCRLRCCSKMSDISALGSLLRFWDGVGYASTALVFIGVVGESLVELTNWMKLPERKKRIGKASALILILGLAGELISTVKISGVTGEIDPKHRGGRRQKIRR